MRSEENTVLSKELEQYSKLCKDESESDDTISLDYSLIWYIVSFFFE